MVLCRRGKDPARLFGRTTDAAIGSVRHTRRRGLRDPLAFCYCRDSCPQGGVTQLDYRVIEFLAPRGDDCTSHLRRAFFDEEDPLDVLVWLDTLWSRLDQGFGVEALHKMDPVRHELEIGQPIRMEVVERCLEGVNKGLLRTGTLHPITPFLLDPFWWIICFAEPDRAQWMSRYIKGIGALLSGLGIGGISLWNMLRV